MFEMDTSSLMSGEGKQSAACEAPVKRPSSTLPDFTPYFVAGDRSPMAVKGGGCEVAIHGLRSARQHNALPGERTAQCFANTDSRVFKFPRCIERSQTLCTGPAVWRH